MEATRPDEVGLTGHYAAIEKFQPVTKMLEEKEVGDKANELSKGRTGRTMNKPTMSARSMSTGAARLSQPHAREKWSMT